ncbi:hypothetical protein ABZY20_22280 [Streptomyces sp. NPDC006624]|uniref:hypothetical protein n=1 Tax=unclassified Streptomyces TaxID=2593676 RepID=UPI0033A38968
MDLTRYIDNLRREVSVAAEAEGEEGRLLAERLVAQLSSALQLTLLEALSDAAGEITRELVPGSVELRLRGLDPGFVVTLPPEDRAYEAEADAEEFKHAPSSGTASMHPESVPLGGEGSGTARINFRPPEYLKTKIEEAAGRERLSVNAWLIRVVSSMLESDERGRPERRAPRSGALRQVQRYTGWVR